MSSTYRVLCLSHDPALVIETPDWNRPEHAEAAIRDGITGHEGCDLGIGRYSYPLVEFGCPRTFDLPEPLRGTVLRCCHGSTQWIDKDWLLLLTAAYQSADPAMRAAIEAGHHGCLPWDRLRRLRVELGVTVAEPDDADLSEADVDRMMAVGAPAQIIAPPDTYAVLPGCARCGMFDYKHEGSS